MNEDLLIWLSLANYINDQNYVFHEETHFLRTIPAPQLSNSCLVIHIGWRAERNRSSNPNRVFKFSQSNNLDLHAGTGYGNYFSFNLSKKTSLNRTMLTYQSLLRSITYASYNTFMHTSLDSSPMKNGLNMRRKHLEHHHLY